MIWLAVLKRNRRGSRASPNLQSWTTNSNSLVFVFLLYKHHPPIYNFDFQHFLHYLILLSFFVFVENLAILCLRSWESATPNRACSQKLWWFFLLYFLWISNFIFDKKKRLILVIYTGFMLIFLSSVIYFSKLYIFPWSSGWSWIQRIQPQRQCWPWFCKSLSPPYMHMGF